VPRFSGRPFPDVDLRGSSDPATCEDCHRDRRHQPRPVTRPLGGPTGPRWDGGPAQGLIELEVSSLGGSRLCRHQWCTQGAGWAVPSFSLGEVLTGLYNPVTLTVTGNELKMTMMIAFITINSGLVPLNEGLCAQI